MLSHVWLFVTPCQASLFITSSRNLPKLMSIESVMPSNHLILCHPLLLLPSIFPNIRVFSNEAAFCIRWPKYWSFGFNISPSNEHQGLISLRMDWLDLLAVQGTLKSLLKSNQYYFMINHNWPTKYLLSHFSWRNESIERERHYLKLLICWLSAAGFELKNYGNFYFYEV